jgi:hypothetical protein
MRHSTTRPLATHTENRKESSEMKRYLDIRRPQTLKTLVALATAAAITVTSLAGCAVAAAPVAERQGPDPSAVVTGFYGWYTGYAQEGNPIADGAYKGSPYLTAGLVSDVAETVAGFQGGGFDLFLCAQDVPARLSVAEEAIEGDEATVSVDALFGGSPTNYRYDLSLVREGGEWKIAEVACGSSRHLPLTAEQTVQAFYDLYLDAAGRYNPLVEGRYQGYPYLSEGFVAKVDEIVAGFARGGYDPFLCAQDLPQEVTVTGVEVEGSRATTEVETSFEGHRLTVALEQTEGRWLISDISCTGR